MTKDEILKEMEVCKSQIHDLSIAISKEQDYHKMIPMIDYQQDLLMQIRDLDATYKKKFRQERIFLVLEL